MAKVARAWGPFFAVAIPGIAVMALGAVQLAGWLVDPSWLLRLENAPTMPPASALGMVLAGAALLAAHRQSRTADRLRHGAAVAMYALALAGIAGYVNLPPPTELGFVMTAFLLIGYDRPRDRGMALLVQVLAGALLALGAVSLIAYDVTPEGLIAVYRYGRMAAPTAAGFAAIGIAMLALIASSPWYETVYAGREDEKILILSLGIFTLVLIGASSVGFVAMQRNIEAEMRGKLSRAVADRATLLQGGIAGRGARARLVSDRPGIAAALRRNDLETLREEGIAALVSGFTGFVFLDADTRPLAEAGDPLHEARMVMRIHGQRHETYLLWNEGFLLRVLTPVYEGGRLLGWVRSDQEMDVIGVYQADASGLGTNAEWELCSATGALHMACFPQRFRDVPWAGSRYRNETPLPMHFALAGERGVQLASSHSGRRVIAGYGPAAGTGLGIVVQIPTAEFYAPLREQLLGWWQWFFAIAILGALLVASQVRPVAQRLVASENLARTRAEALARSERALREVYESLADGIVVFAPDGTIEFANPAAERIFGYGAGELDGKPVGVLIPAPLRAANAAATQRFLETGVSSLAGQRGVVYPALRRDGREIHIEFSLAQMRQEDSLRLVGVVRDVSERTALDRMKSEFIAAVSHELRTPLTAIIGALDLLREAELGPAEREFLDMALRNGERLAMLVNDIIDLERIEGGMLRFDATRFDVGALLADAVRINQPYGAKHEVRFVLEEPAPRAVVEADRGRLMQVLANLLSNAAKFSPPGSEVKVRARRLDGHVRVEVEDRGRGIPPEFHARVFDKFAQADASDAREKGGSGLGLAICKGIVERSGGRIGFDTRPGVGTTFWFELPASG